MGGLSTSAAVAMNESFFCKQLRKINSFRIDLYLLKKLSRGAVFLDFVTMYVYAWNHVRSFSSVRSVIPVNIDVKVCMSFDKNQALYLRVGF